jgi:hypothetical protein
MSQNDGTMYTKEMQVAFDCLLSMTDEQRALVLTWFCRNCWRYVGPGDACHCEDDELNNLR